MRSSRGRRVAFAAAAIVAGLAVRAKAHSTPFSYVDVRVQGARIDVTFPVRGAPAFGGRHAPPSGRRRLGRRRRRRVVLVRGASMGDLAVAALVEP